MSRTFRATTAVVAVGAFLLGGTKADASVKIAWAAKNPTLEVSALGAAEVSWTTPSGVRRHVRVDPDRRAPLRRAPQAPERRCTHRSHPLAAQGDGLANPEWGVLGAPAMAPHQGPPGRASLLALAAAHRRASRFEPSAASGEASRITGQASFHGRPIYGYYNTPAGVPLDKYGRNVYLDTLRYGSWKRMMGILTHRYDGTYSLWIRRYWRGKRYRATISGPNWGWTIAPDARAWTNSAL